MKVAADGASIAARAGARSNLNLRAAATIGLWANHVRHGQSASLASQPPYLIAYNDAA